jgi:hypothetical protein
MMVRVGVDASIDEAVLDFTKEVNLVRVPESRRETLQSASGSPPCLPGYCDASGRT